MASAEIYDEYNEGSSFAVTVAFKDKDGVAALPTTVTYEVYDYHTGTILKASTTVVPELSIVITVTSDLNRLVKEHRDKELHILLVKTNYGTGDDFNAEYRFYVKNLGRV